MRRVRPGTVSLRVLALLAAVLAAPAGARAADPEFSVTADRSVMAWPADRGLTYRVSIRTAAEPERFVLQVADVPRDFIGFDGRPEGNLLHFTWGDARLEGAGAADCYMRYHGDPGPLYWQAPGLDLRHGESRSTATWDCRVSLPADSAATLVLPASAAAEAPFPGEAYGTAIAARNRASYEVPPGEPPDTLDGPRQLAVPTVPAAGPRGVRLDVRADVAFVRDPYEVPPAVEGAPITLRGQADPSVAGDRLELLHIGPRAVAPRPLATAVVDADGRFELRDWRPSQTGVHVVAARYTSQRADRTDDFSRPLAFDLKSPAPPAPAGEAGPSLTLRAAVAEQRRRARIRVGCGRPCRVALTLRGRRCRRSRTVQIDGSGRETVRLPLRGACWRRLARGRSLLLRAAALGEPDVSSRTVRLARKR